MLLIVPETPLTFAYERMAASTPDASPAIAGEASAMYEYRTKTTQICETARILTSLMVWLSVRRASFSGIENVLTDC